MFIIKILAPPPASGDWTHLVDFWPFLQREMTCVTSCLLPCAATTYRGIYIKTEKFPLSRPLS